MRVEVVDQPERWIVGVATRTCNADEMDPQRSRLGRLWQRAAPDGEMVAVLTDYESDRHGEYTEVVGRPITDLSDLPETLVAVRVPPVRYARVAGEGEGPAAIMDAWRQVWLAEDGGELRRSYRTDFELWPAGGSPVLYLSVQA